MKLDQTSRDVLTVLQKAARRVARKDGWLQGYIGDWHSRTGAVCAVGAIKAVDPTGRVRWAIAAGSS